MKWITLILRIVWDISEQSVLVVNVMDVGGMGECEDLSDFVKDQTVNTVNGLRRNKPWTSDRVLAPPHNLWEAQV